MSKKDEKIRSRGIIYEVTSEEFKEHLSHRIADLGSAIEGKGLITKALSVDRIKEFMRKLRKYEWAYKHLPKNFIFDIDMKEAMENELPVIDVYEQQIIDTINESSKLHKL